MPLLDSEGKPTKLIDKTGVLPPLSPSSGLHSLHIIPVDFNDYIDGNMYKISLYRLDTLKTIRELGLKDGEQVWLEDEEAPSHVLGTLKKDVTSAGKPLGLHAIPHWATTRRKTVVNGVGSSSREVVE